MSERSPAVFTGVVITGAAFAIGKAWWNRTSLETRRNIRDWWDENDKSIKILGFLVLSIFVIKGLERAGILGFRRPDDNRRRLKALINFLTMVAFSFIISYAYTKLFMVSEEWRDNSVDFFDEPFAPIFIGAIWLLGPIVYSSWARTTSGKLKAIVLGYTIPPLVLFTLGITKVFD